MAQFRNQCLWIFVAAGLSIPQPAAADTVAIAPLKDNTLYEDPAGALSNGRGQNFFSGANGAGLRHRGIIAFDIAANIPEGSTINSANLTLHMSRTIGDPVTISLHRCLAHWGEGNSIAPGNEGRGAPAARATRRGCTPSTMRASGQIPAVISAARRAPRFSWPTSISTPGLRQRRSLLTCSLGWIPLR